MLCVIHYLLRVTFVGALLVTSSRGFAAESVSQVRLVDAIRAAADYLHSAGKPNGQFVYRVSIDGQAIVPRYNILRHAGTIYALSSYHQLVTPESKSALLPATRFLQAQIGEVDQLPNTLAIWSDPKIHLGNSRRKAKLGGTGLGLVGLAQVERLMPGTVPIQQLQQLGNFLLFMQKDNGGFYSIYYPGQGRNDEWTSLYYPGEAALGLLMLYELDADPEWRIGAVECLTYLAQLRKSQDTVPADHWALLATQALFSLPADTQYERRLLLAHTRQLARQILAEQRPQQDHPTLHGCFTDDGRTTPTATRLEGLLAARAVLPKDDTELHADISRACVAGVQFLLQQQISKGDLRGGIPRARGPLPRDHTLYSEAFNARATEIRIDYVQHALSAFLAFQQQWFPSTDEPPRP